VRAAGSCCRACGSQRSEMTQGSTGHFRQTHEQSSRVLRSASLAMP